jgi:MFS family permease
MFNRHNMTCIFAVGFGSFTSLLSSTTIEVAFPQMMGALALDLNQVQWTITLYMIVMTIAMLLAADVVKRIGVKSTFVLSFVIMSIGSLIGGLSDNLLVLLTGRFFQGFAAGLQAPLATIILGQIFPKNKMGIAMGFFGAIMLMAPAMGPVVGGYIIEVLSWREVFHFQLPMAALSIILAMFYLPNTTDVTREAID